MNTDLMATNWYYTKQGAPSGGPPGQQVGPLVWAELYGRGQTGEFDPGDLVCNPGLPRWMRADQVPSLLAAAVAPRMTQPGGRRRSWLIPVVFPLIALAVAGAGLGACIGPRDSGDGSDVSATHGSTTDVSTTAPSNGTTSTDTTPFDWIMAGPTVIDVASSEISNTTVSPAGAVIDAGFIAVDIPAGAVAKDTNIVLTRLDAPFHRDPSAISDPEAVEARAISSSYDIGPAGTSFAKPAIITLHYDLGYGPVEIDPGRIGVAYWTGESWAVAGGTVDPEARTVSVQLQEIDGELVTTILAATAVGLAANRIIKWYTGGDEGVMSDPLSEDRAQEFITPKDPTVQKQVRKAVILNTRTNDSKALDDPDLGTWMANTKDSDLSLAFKDSTGKPNKMGDDLGEGSNWQKPSHFFSTGTANSGANFGDCTDTTNAAVSIFRAMGFPAKGIFGYGGSGDTTQPHNWGEVLIGGVPYRIDSGGLLFSPERDDFYTGEYKPCTDPNDPRYKSMYDEKGQQAYDPKWWAAYDISGHWEGSGTLNVNGKATTVPWTMDVELNHDGSGTATTRLDVGGVDSKGAHVSTEPSTSTFTYADRTLTFAVSGGTMSATVSKEGDRLVMNGHMGDGSGGWTWTVTKSP